MPRLRVRAFALVLGFLLALSGLSPAVAATTVSPTPTSSWGVDGRVYAVVIAGDTAYVGGSFQQAVSPSGALVARKNLAAFSVSTGALRTDFRADAGATVAALATDGTSLYVAGHFSQLQGVSRARLAKINLGTGKVDTAFRANANGAVLGLDVADGFLYAGGSFSTVGGVQRVRLAKVSTTSGAVDSTFRASADATVRDVRKSPSSAVLYVGGAFATLTGKSRAGVGAVSSSTGATTPTVFAGAVRPTLALDVNDDGTMLYGALAAGSNSATAWRTSDGARVWRRTAMGDTQAVDHIGGRVYFGFHEGYGGDTTLKLLAADARTGALIESFKPRFDKFWGVYAIAAWPSGVIAGGEFSSVEGVRARNLVRFLGYPG